MSTPPIDNTGNRDVGASPGSQQEALLYDRRDPPFSKNPIGWFERRVENAIIDGTPEGVHSADKHNFNKKKWAVGALIALATAVIVGLVAIPVLLKVVLIIALIGAVTCCIAKAVFHHQVESGVRPKTHAE